MYSYLHVNTVYEVYVQTGSVFVVEADSLMESHFSEFLRVDSLQVS